MCFTKQRHKRPIIGFGGSINYRLDFDLLIQVCKQLPNCDFEFYGQYYSAEEDELLDVRNKMNQLFQLKNVHLKKFLPRTQLYNKVKQWDIAIIPYNLNVPLNYFCKPLKLYEYFFFGLPVLSTSLPSIRNYKNLIHFADTPKKWISEIQRILLYPEKETFSEYKRKEALKNTWQKKISFALEKLAKVNS